jgi:hypothetical protein
VGVAADDSMLGLRRRDRLGARARRVRLTGMSEQVVPMKVGTPATEVEVHGYATRLRGGSIRVS